MVCLNPRKPPLAYVHCSALSSCRPSGPASTGFHCVHHVDTRTRYPMSRRRAYYTRNHNTRFLVTAVKSVRRVHNNCYSQRRSSVHAIAIRTTCDIVYSRRRHLHDFATSRGAKTPRNPASARYADDNDNKLHDRSENRRTHAYRRQYNTCPFDNIPRRVCVYTCAQRR